jgi:hypothetical protein
MTNASGARPSPPAARVWLAAATTVCYGCFVALSIWLLGGGGVFWSAVALAGLAVISVAYARSRHLPLRWAILTFVAALFVGILVAFVALLIALSQIEMD